jgi:PmbA protein
MWAALAERTDDRVISASAWQSDGRSSVARVMSNGFEGVNEGGWFALGGDMTMQDENGKRPEAGAYYSARHKADAPAFDTIAAEVLRRCEERLDAGPIASGTYPMILLNRAAPRLLSTLAGPLAGSALHNKRSCMADRLDTAVASEHLTLIDDPTISRGLGSRPWDGDCIAAKRRTIIDGGVLRSFYINTYYSRKLGMDATTGGRSNWIISPGDQSYADIAKAWPKAILVTGFLGGNNNGATGDFSYGIRGVLLEHGEPAGALSEMNISDNATRFFHKLTAVANDPWKWSSVRCPSFVFEDVQFSGT